MTQTSIIRSSWARIARKGQCGQVSRAIKSDEVAIVACCASTICERGAPSFREGICRASQASRQIARIRHWVERVSRTLSTFSPWRPEISRSANAICDIHTFRRRMLTKWAVKAIRFIHASYLVPVGASGTFGAAITPACQIILQVTIITCGTLARSTSWAACAGRRSEWTTQARYVAGTTHLWIVSMRRAVDTG